MDIFQAVYENDQHKLLAFLNSEIDVNVLSPIGITPLHAACGVGNVDIVKLLILNGADVNCKNRWNETPLHVACSSNALIPIVAILLSNGADPHAEKVNGETPLSLACCLGNEQMVKVLLANGANPMVRNKGGLTAFDFARSRNITKILSSQVPPDAVQAKNQNSSVSHFEYIIYTSVAVAGLCVLFFVLKKNH